MRALWAARVSVFSLGIAMPSICWLSAPSLVCCTTCTLVIFLPVIVSATCIGPYGVFSTAPVTLCVAVMAPEPADFFPAADFPPAADCFADADCPGAVDGFAVGVDCGAAGPVSAATVAG